jgi:hypothetical protein
MLHSHLTTTHTTLLLSSQYLSSSQCLEDMSRCDFLLQWMQANGGQPLPHQLPPHESWLLKVADFGLSRTGALAGTNVVSQVTMTGASIEVPFVTFSHITLAVERALDAG